MLPVVSVQTMRESDAWTIEHETSGPELMLRAAQGIRDAVDWDRGAPVGIVIGSGNNGGDGAALAMLLAQAGRPCTLYRVSEKASPDSAFYLEKAMALGVPVLPFAGHEADVAACGILVDCLADYLWNYPRVMCIFWFVFALTIAGIKVCCSGERSTESQ